MSDDEDRTSNFVFYSGNARKNSKDWGGCDRTMIKPLETRTDMHVHLVGNNQRLAQEDYNKFMKQSYRQEQMKH